MGRQLADDQPVRAQLAGDVIAVGLALCRFFDIKNVRMIAGDLHRFVTFAAAQPASPSSVLNGAFSPINCDRKMPGPFIVLIPLLNITPCHRHT
jgi:hypothetical protein